RVSPNGSRLSWPAPCGARIVKIWPLLRGCSNRRTQIETAMRGAMIAGCSSRSHRSTEANKHILDVAELGYQSDFTATTTFSFQAPAFYERHGFEVIATLDNHPRGHQNMLMRKRLGPDS